MQLELPLIKHEQEGNIICQRVQDGYVNATAMCKAADKEWKYYNELESTKKFLQELSEVKKCDIKASGRMTTTALVCTIQGGIPESQGTWVHPQVAINLGQWLSPQFAVKVTEWVFDWVNNKVSKSRLPYHLRRYIDNMRRIPSGYFSVLQEMTIVLVGPLEQQGYDIPSNMVPDISEGKIFAKWLRAKGVDVDNMPTYQHRYEDGRVVDAKLYPMKYLEELRLHIAQEWLPKRALKYFQERDITALQYLEPVLQLNEQYNYGIIN